MAKASPQRRQAVREAKTRSEQRARAGERGGAASGILRAMPEVVVAPVREGDILAAKYRVDRVLGAGGMGVVVAATHLQLEQRVALKFLISGLDADACLRFLREARAVVKLKSEHIVRVLDTGTLESGMPYIVMELLEGRDLAAELAARGPIGIVEAVDWVLQACEGIAEAHMAGIVHRDLKPANLFLTHRADHSPLIKVLDFGIAKTLSVARAPDYSLTKTSALMGSPHYMSPEQIRNAKSVDCRADIWAPARRSLPPPRPRFWRKSWPIRRGRYAHFGRTCRADSKR
jgi:serine/threonine-protein kinase